VAVHVMVRGQEAMLSAAIGGSCWHENGCGSGDGGC
jgi:hypothetical protein